VATSLEAILLSVASLLSRVFARDSLKGRGIITLILWTRTLGAGHWERRIRFREPAIDVKSAVSRLKLFLESFPQPGPVEELGLKITGLGYRHGRQRSLFAEVRAKDHLLNDIKQLELRLGNPEVFQIKEVEPWSRIPERRYALAPLSR
jgi:DNA polymerase-4/protein ImuB